LDREGEMNYFWICVCVLMVGLDGGYVSVLLHT
jgi:hypothetical protein